MNIHLHLFASLTTKCLGLIKDPDKDFFEISCKEGANIENLIDQIKLPKKEVKIIFINGKHASFSSELRDGDRVGIFPAIGGG